MTIKEKLQPTAEEKKRELEFAGEIVKLIKKKFGRQSVLVGSLAKDTDLRGNKDVDIFVLFPKNTPRKNLEKEGLRIGKHVCKEIGAEPEIHYAEHPYVRACLEGYDVEIVPCYKLKRGEKIMSAVDRTPFHTKYVQKNLKEPSEVRLLKKFMHDIGVYGAEQEVQGFSGYLCELLVIKYGSFKNVLKNAAGWGKKTIITVDGKKPEKKFPEPLVVVDPVDDARNVAAAVSKEKLFTFVLLADAWLKGAVKRATEKREGHLLVVEWNLKKHDIEEILWSQLERFQKKVVKLLGHHGFRVMDSEIWTDSRKKAQLLLELEVFKLPGIKVHEGPGVYHTKRVKEFTGKYSKVRVNEDGFLVTKKKREYTNARKLMETLVKKEPPSHLKGLKFRLIENPKSLEVLGKHRKKYWRL